MRSLIVAVLIAFVSPAFAGDGKPVEMTLEDQFGAKQEPKGHRGKVVVMVYGDRKATDDCRTIGESLHVAFHPTAKGLAAKEARQQPVVALTNLPAGKVSPEVFVVPVACTGKIPNVVKTVLQTQIKKASPDVPVWLDSDESMSGAFGLTTGEPNLVVLDVQGRARFIVNGKADAKKLQEVAQVIQDLRAEAVAK